jgi:hypothetical protein
MRICPTLNNNIITNNYKTEITMTEDAPNATDHDDDSKRIASSYPLIGARANAYRCVNRQLLCTNFRAVVYSQN